MRWRRRDDDHENPAWPGLVDLFAFGMVLISVFWAMAANVPDLREELKTANAEIERLKSMIDRSKAHERAVALRNQLAHEIGPEIEFGDVPPNESEFPIRTIRGRRLEFDTNVHDLRPEDQDALRSAAQILVASLGRQPTAVLILKGSADPREFRVRPTSPPRNNVELSALRAAGVAFLLRDGAGEDGASALNRMQVVGLGEQGRLDPAVTNPDEFYREFRAVRLAIGIDRSVMPR